jgi:CYTH domain-containing protein
VAFEIERKFLVVGDGWRAGAGPGLPICQGYLAKTGRGSIRVRRLGDAAMVTVKGKRNGISRTEFEYPIPVEDAEQMLRELCRQPLVEKVRHEVEYCGLQWEIDVFLGASDGLILAEVELDRADRNVALPPWVGADVTHDPRFRNSAIAARARKRTLEAALAARLQPAI